MQVRRCGGRAAAVARYQIAVLLRWGALAANTITLCESQSNDGLREGENSRENSHPLFAQTNVRGELLKSTTR